GDGYEDNVVIGLDVPLSDKYTLKLYDVSGNIVKLFYDNKQYIPNQTVWDGLDDKNERLPIGIYVLYLSTEEGESTKETIVIAR
ncbi:MAG TPA: T9SS type A sorting domain-containing protein, partial [candidate division Zixibacteria bacterium]|nr:T9SS type A sorting domain-containing protein [candidate division Zixibacteria bacterium]